MLALAEVRAQEDADRCHLCGLPTAICRDSALEGSVPVDAERCYVSLAVASEREKFTNPGQGMKAADHPGSLDFIPKVPNPLADVLGDSVPESST